MLSGLLVSLATGFLTCLREESFSIRSLYWKGGREVEWREREREISHFAHSPRETELTVTVLHLQPGICSREGDKTSAHQSA